MDLVKRCITLLSVLAFALTLDAVPAMAQGVAYDKDPIFEDIAYDNGPVNGNLLSWLISKSSTGYPYSVTDSFHLMASSSIVEVDFWAWVTPGDVLSSVQVQLGNSPFGGTAVLGPFMLSQTNCFSNTGNVNVCLEAVRWLTPVNLSEGDYWVTLSHAQTLLNNPVGWDENFGIGCKSDGCPSTASPSVAAVSTIPSEAFTIVPSQ
jgi:hypothetical protein